MLIQNVNEAIQQIVSWKMFSYKNIFFFIISKTILNKNLKNELVGFEKKSLCNSNFNLSSEMHHVMFSYFFYLFIDFFFE